MNYHKVPKVSARQLGLWAEISFVIWCAITAIGVKWLVELCTQPAGFPYRLTACVVILNLLWCFQDLYRQALQQHYHAPRHS